MWSSAVFFSQIIYISFSLENLSSCFFFRQWLKLCQYDDFYTSCQQLQLSTSASQPISGMASRSLAFLLQASLTQFGSDAQVLFKFKCLIKTVSLVALSLTKARESFFLNLLVALPNWVKTNIHCSKLSLWLQLTFLCQKYLKVLSSQGC